MSMHGGRVEKFSEEEHIEQSLELEGRPSSLRSASEFVQEIENSSQIVL
jgi:hypothetical protein